MSVARIRTAEGGSHLVYIMLGRTGYLRNTAYKWSHMINNLASAMFGFIYIALWQAVAPVSSATTPYTKATMTDMMVMAQVFAWISFFMPAGLGIARSVRSGSIALDVVRPIPYFPMIIAREAGDLAYRVLYRCIPLAVIFGVTVGFPAPASPAHLLLAIPSVMLAGYIGLTFAYTVGISSLWTTEIRFANWTYFTTVSLLSGGWVPADLLPGFLGAVAPYLPFAGQLFWPVRIYLGLSGAEGLAVQAVWAALLTLWCVWITRQGIRRLVVQGG